MLAQLVLSIAVLGLCWQAGVVLRPEQVQPLYVRDKVAKTIAEREAEHAVTQVLAHE